MSTPAPFVATHALTLLGEDYPALVTSFLGAAERFFDRIGDALLAAEQRFGVPLMNAYLNLKPLSPVGSVCATLLIPLFLGGAFLINRLP